jgi:hypothetical protein
MDVDKVPDKVENSITLHLWSRYKFDKNSHYGDLSFPGSDSAYIQNET